MMIGDLDGQEMETKQEKEDEVNLQEIKDEKEEETKAKKTNLNYPKKNQNPTRTTMRTTRMTMNHRTLMTTMEVTPMTNTS